MTVALVRSGRFHGDRLRGGIGGDQDEEFVGLIRRVKLSSLGSTTELSGATGRAVVGRRTRCVCYRPR